MSSPSRACHRSCVHVPIAVDSSSPHSERLECSQSDMSKARLRIHRKVVGHVTACDAVPQFRCMLYDRATMNRDVLACNRFQSTGCAAQIYREWVFAWHNRYMHVSGIDSVTVMCAGVHPVSHMATADTYTLAAVACRCVQGSAYALCPNNDPIRVRLRHWANHANGTSPWPLESTCAPYCG